MNFFIVSFMFIIFGYLLLLIIWGILYCFFIVLFSYGMTLQSLNPSKMDTAGSSRQLIKLHHPSRTYPIYIMRIGLWPTILKFFDNLSLKSIRTAHHKSHQLVMKVKRHHVIGSNSPVTNPSCELTNINVT